MSGHSKWPLSSTRRRLRTPQRGKTFTRIIKEITIAARSGGDPDGKSAVRSAVLAGQGGEHAVGQTSRKRSSRHRRNPRAAQIDD